MERRKNGGCRALNFFLIFPSLNLSVSHCIQNLTLAMVVSTGGTLWAQASGVDARAEVRDVVLMLQGAPVHVRFRISLGGTAPDIARAKYIDGLVKSLDTDMDGELSRSEASQSPLLRKKERPGAESFLRTVNVKQVISRRDVEIMVERVAGQTVVYRQDDSASESDQFIFELLDDDGSGTIDAAEMQTASTRLAKHDRDMDECIGFDEIQPPPTQPDPRAPQVAASEPQPRATFSELMRDTSEPLLPRRLIRAYDRNGDGKLSGKELGWDRERVAMIDKTGDGDLSVTELRRISETPVDLDLAIDVAPLDAGKPQLTVLSVAGRPDDRVVRPGIASLQLEDAAVTVSYRHVDPIPAAIDNAMRRFNLLDADGNGYLDPQEVETDVRLRRGLFDMIDADGDQKVFGEEMEAYVRTRAEPDSTSCRVNVYDTGSGFFQSLDHNNDGRISTREMRSVEASLQAMQHDAAPGVSIEEPSRRFHIEFVRGTYRMFGSSDNLVRQSPSFNSYGAVGPIWFQAWDRNNDGDLTWMEFQGPREVFYQLDADDDELIDPVEAEQAASM